MRFFAALLATILIVGTAVAAPSPARAVTDGDIDSAWIHLVNEDDVVHLDDDIEAEGHEQLYLSEPSTQFELELDLSELGDDHDLADGFTLTLTNGAFSGDYTTTTTDGNADVAACTTTWEDAGVGGGVLAGDVLCTGAGVNHGTTIPFAITLPATGPVVLDVDTTGEDFSVYFFVAEAGDTIYVGQGAIADGNGSCEAPDFSTDDGAQGSINAALFAAFTAVDDDSDVIVICDGEYSYQDNFGYSYEGSFKRFDGSQFHDSITLRAETTGGVTLYGGLEEDSLEDLFLELLDELDFTDGYKLVHVYSADLSVTGIRFAGGSSGIIGGEDIALQAGGAISVEDGSLSLERVTFDHNFGILGGAVAVLGGSLTANRVVAQDNLALGGGAIVVGDLFSEDAPDSTISNSTFSNNYGIEAGGAVLQAGGRMKLTSVGFTENRTAGAGGAILAYGELEITGGYFKDNQCDLDWFAELVDGGEEGFEELCDGGAIGVGISILGGEEAPVIVESLAISGTKFSRNEASGSGGAIYLTGVSSSFAISRSSLTQNTAGDQGGAIRLDNANRFTTISVSVFTGNRAVQGGAISMNDGVGEDLLAHQWGLTRNTFTGNQATLNGGALHMAFDNSGNVSPSNVRSNRFMRNSAPNGGAIVVESDFGSEQPILRRFERALRSNQFTGNRATENRRTNSIGVHFD